MIEKGILTMRNRYICFGFESVWTDLKAFGKGKNGALGDPYYLQANNKIRNKPESPVSYTDAAEVIAGDISTMSCHSRW